MDPLFPEIPEDLKGLSDEEVQQLLDDHISAAALIDADDAEFLKDMSGDDVIAQYTAGVEQIQKLRAEHKEREDAHAVYQAKKAELAAQVNPSADDEEEGDGDDSEKETEEAPLEVVAEAEETETEEAVEETEETEEATEEE